MASKSLLTNSTNQNIHAHLLKCRKCPTTIKEQLDQLKLEKSRAAWLEPGWRKVFFDKVWQRLHYCESNNSNSNNSNSNNSSNNSSSSYGNNTITDTNKNNNDDKDNDDNDVNNNKATTTGQEQ